MLITKNKSYTQILLSEAKEFCKVEESDTTYDGLISRLIKASVTDVENFISDDIVTTVSTLEEESYLVNLTALNYYLPSSNNVAVSAITVTQGYPSQTTTQVISSSTYGVEKFQNYTNIQFQTSISYNKLVIIYSSGFVIVPDIIKTAIFMRINDYLDQNRSSYTQGRVTYSGAWERLLSPYKNLFY